MAMGAWPRLLPAAHLLPVLAQAAEAQMSWMRALLTGGKSQIACCVNADANTHTHKKKGGGKWSVRDGAGDWDHPHLGKGLYLDGL